MEEKIYICVKCKKEKKESEGKVNIEGEDYCCMECCGELEKEEHKETKENVCEFC